MYIIYVLGYSPTSLVYTLQGKLHVTATKLHISTIVEVILRIFLCSFYVLLRCLVYFIFSSTSSVRHAKKMYVSLILKRFM